MNFSKPLVSASLLLACVSISAQSRRRVAIIPADRLQQSDYRQPSEQAKAIVSLEEKLVNALTSSLAGAGSLEIVDREQTDQLLHEQDQKENARYDASNSAVKLGKMLAVDTLIVVRVETFNWETPENHASKFLYDDVTVKGLIHYTASAKAIDASTGSVIAAPSVVVDKDEVIRKYKQIDDQSHPRSMADKSNDESLKKAGIVKLLDTSVQATSTDLTAKLSKSFSARSVASAPSTPKVVGLDSGKVLLNRGSIAGLKKGERLSIIRMVDSGFKDPDTGKSIIRKKKICLLTLTDIEENLSSGSCAGDVPQAGDIATPETT